MAQIREKNLFQLALFHSCWVWRGL